VLETTAGLYAGDVSSKVLVPAIVAAVVTLLIEYLAKPRLEARKERLLERARDKRSLIRVLSLLSISIAALSDVNAVSAVPAFVHAELQRATEYIQQARESSVTVLPRLPEPLRSLIARACGFTLAKIILLQLALGTHESSDLSVAVSGLTDANDNLGVVLNYLLCPNWRLVVKLRLFEKVNGANQKLLSQSEGH
jgi:hypothetical protein